MVAQNLGPTGQWQGSTTTNDDIYRNGFVGIGNTNPFNLLHVGTNIIFADGGHSVIGFGYEPTTFFNLSPTEYSSEIRLDRANGRFSFGISSNPTFNPVSILVLNKNGNVGIGTNNPDQKLTVNGSIHAKEVKVDLNIPADYVFQKYYNGESLLKPEYKMPTLEEVEAFTKANNHLPEIPSAQEIQENGLMLKEMTNLLLQKVEELTLYVIEHKKKINHLESLLKKDNVPTKNLEK